MRFSCLHIRFVLFNVVYVIIWILFLTTTGWLFQAWWFCTRSSGGITAARSICSIESVCCCRWWCYCCFDIADKWFDVSTYLLVVLFQAIIYLTLPYQSSTAGQKMFQGGHSDADKPKYPVPAELVWVVVATLASAYGKFADKYELTIVGTIPTGLLWYIVCRISLSVVFIKIICSNYYHLSPFTKT